MLLSVLKRADFFLGKAILKLGPSYRQLVFVNDNFVAYVEIFRERGQRAEDNELQENRDSVNPVALSESDIIGYLADPDPPHQRKEKNVWGAGLSHQLYD